MRLLDSVTDYVYTVVLENGRVTSTLHGAGCLAVTGYSPEEFAKDQERLERLLREAQTLASLNHPNIAAIYGLDDEGGTPRLVLELVAGESLAQRLERGAMPMAEAASSSCCASVSSRSVPIGAGCVGGSMG